MLKKIGIDLQLDVVEPAVFHFSVRKGAFQLFSSRWVGISDGSILYSTLRSGQPQNRVGYNNPKMDAILDQAVHEMDPKKRLPLIQESQELLAADLPYFPLWYWKNILILRKGMKRNGTQEITPNDLSLSGALELLTEIPPL
jgi:ABC-type transport system substrate-binding protein